MFIVIFSILLAAIFLLIHYPYTYWKRRGVTFLKPNILIGNLAPFIRRDESFSFCAANLYHKTDERFTGIYMFLQPILLIRDADLVKQVLVTDFANFHDRGIHANEEIHSLSANLFNLEGKKWKNLRNSLTPIFTTSKLKKMFSIIDMIGEKIDEYLENELKNDVQIVDMKTIASRYATDFVVSTFFGLETNSFKDENHVFAQVRDEFAGKGLLRNLAGATMIFAPRLFELLQLYKANDKINKTMLDTVQKTIEYRKQTNTERNDFMQLLMQLQNTENNKRDSDLDAKEIVENKKTLSLNEITAQAVLFLVAGLETTSATIYYCFHEITQNEEIMEKLIDDIESAVKRHNGVISYETIEDMQYLELVILETLRLYPSLPILNRICTKAYKIPNSDVTIEAGTPILISILGLHTDPKYFANPKKFDPERFREENSTHNANAFIPFGDGPRSCIGLRQGKISAKAAIVRLLRNYKWSATEKRKMEFENYGFTLMPKGGVKLKFSKR